VAQQISIDDVGNAEAVLVRLINERKALESAQQVLMTYRMVKGQLEPAVSQLREVEQRVSEAQQRLADVKGSIENEEKVIDAHLAEYRGKALANVEKEISDLKKGYDELDMEYDKLVVRMEEASAQHDRVIIARSEDLERVDAALTVAKREHAVLAEAIGGAAAFFKAG
jgi:DNA repair exonuclease SbcCD ATPase subunit